MRPNKIPKLDEEQHTVRYFFNKAMVAIAIVSKKLPLRIACYAVPMEKKNKNMQIFHKCGWLEISTMADILWNYTLRSIYRH